MYDNRLDPDLEKEQLRRDEMRARRGPVGFVGDVVGGFLSGLLWIVLIVVLVIVLLVWIL
jgi:hypothetical protein